MACLWLGTLTWMIVGRLISFLLMLRYFADVFLVSSPVIDGVALCLLLVYCYAFTDPLNGYQTLLGTHVCNLLWHYIDLVYLLVLCSYFYAINPVLYMYKLIYCICVLYVEMNIKDLVVCTDALLI